MRKDITILTLILLISLPSVCAKGDIQILSDIAPNIEVGPNDKELHRLRGLHSMLSKCGNINDRTAIIRYYLGYFPKQKDAVCATLGSLFADEFALATTAQPKKDFCGTMDAIIFAAYLEQIPEYQSSTIKAGIQNMLDSLEQVYETTHFYIHYTLSDETTIEFITNLASLAEFSWQKQVAEWGYKAPQPYLSLKYNIYVQEDVPSKCEPSLFSSYIIIRPEDTGFYPSTGDNSQLLTTISHEFHHACQNQYLPLTLITQKWVAEGSARWMQHETMRSHPDFSTGEPLGMQHPLAGWEYQMWYTLSRAFLDLKTKSLS